MGWKIEIQSGDCPFIGISMDIKVKNHCRYPEKFNKNLLCNEENCPKKQIHNI